MRVAVRHNAEVAERRRAQRELFEAYLGSVDATGERLIAPVGPHEVGTRTEVVDAWFRERGRELTEAEIPVVEIRASGRLFDRRRTYVARVVEVRDWRVHTDGTHRPELDGATLKGVTWRSSTGTVASDGSLPMRGVFGGIGMHVPGRPRPLDLAATDVTEPSDAPGVSGPR